MKQMKKLFILFTMLIACLSFKEMNSTNEMVIANATKIVDTPVSGSYTYFNGREWKSHLIAKLSKQGVTIDSLKNYFDYK